MEYALISDTSSEALGVLYESLKKMSMQEKIELIKQINEDVEKIALAGIKRAYPHYSEHETRYELSRRRYGSAVADIAYAK